MHHPSENETTANSLAPAHLRQQFDAGWWTRFLDRTEQMSRPCVFADALDAPQARIMRRQVLDILAEIGQIHKAKYGYRLWLDGRQIDDLDEHFAQHPQPHEDIGDWVRRAFGERKFGIILNRGEKFSSGLSQAIAHILEPALRMIGMPTEGILFTVFIGNYDMTPLGIHKDSLGKSVIHFHLGPGPKTMYTWGDDDYVTAPGEKRCNNMDIAPHLPSAARHTFGEGQLYYMPANTFHLGMQDELSVGIACWFYNRSDHDFACELLHRVREAYLRPSEIMLKADRHPIDDIGAAESALALLTLPGGGDLRSLMREVYRDLRYSLFSNGGYRNSPIPRQDKPAMQADSRVAIEPPYRMLCRPAPQAGRLELYVRGTKIALGNFPGLEGIVDRLNGGGKFAVEEIVAMVDDPLAEKKVHYLLGMLHRYRGIVVTPP
ncbi:hypothetical protein [Chromobacterium sphagni]|uniref:JmjC domain-containing protein n=1 Tax=Chromobacterium sphagni TaxID=1903179 RepID=A0A1S1X1P7_9NEIS|nr:hypothetical protein [Chromobacterium sphagni]OHX13096.1 hypothetical protein BI347_05905 [Chromobacterium sphagni]OHX19367.1 hypothetical protein BI344_09645 [Chromobacterium sphagni]